MIAVIIWRNRELPQRSRAAMAKASNCCERSFNASLQKLCAGPMGGHYNHDVVARLDWYAWAVFNSSAGLMFQPHGAGVKNDLLARGPCSFPDISARQWRDFIHGRSRFSMTRDFFLQVRQAPSEGNKISGDVMATM